MHTSVVLDLSQGALLIKYLDTNLTDTPITPFRNERKYIYGSPKATISVVGDVVGAAFPILPLNATNLLRKPFDSAESNMFNFAYNLYTLMYLRMTGQRDPELEKKVFKYLNIQYQRQLSYQNKDGSFRVFRWNNKPSVWLTAFCARIFSKATFQEWESFLYIDRKIISKSVSWLLQQQDSFGAFYEPDNSFYDRKMNSLNKPQHDETRNRSIALTAHVLIALESIRDLKGELSARASNAKTAAKFYLETMLKTVYESGDLFDLAIVSYALSLANSANADTAFSFLDNKIQEMSGMRYWSKEPLPLPKTIIENNRPYLLPRTAQKHDSFNVATTAYALLTHISRQALIRKEIVEWLNNNRLHQNGWGSTQDTIIGYQALIEYSIQSRHRDVTNIEVTIEAPSSPSFLAKVDINKSNLAKLQSFDLPNAYGHIIVKASGSGLAIVQLDVQYNVDWPKFQIPPPVKAFDLEVSMRTFGRNHSHITFKSCQKWTLREESLTSGLTVLDLALPTGYIIQQQELDNYVKSGKVRNLQEAKFQDKKVLFYFDYVSHFFFFFFFLKPIKSIIFFNFL